MRDLNRKGLWLGIGWVFVAVIIWLSLTSAPPAFGGGWGGIDKVQHAFAYLVLTGWFVQLYHRWRPRLFYAALFIAMGAALEFLQGLGGIRHFELADMVANTTGVLLGLASALARVDRVIEEIDSRIG
ncbi:VanZ family protein [Thiohalomonas denitrificans]|uniref:VanZ family protein n=1 Tax=Thiohalomonas denitrificans TaxID=415747 RepID=UPI0026EB9063|nr:VanZ family protein [Thiohalomonas denitrificans]